MYKFLDEHEFDKIESRFGSGTLNTNYEEFMKVYDINRNNRIEAAWETPAGKAIKSQLSANRHQDI